MEVVPGAKRVEIRLGIQENTVAEPVGNGGAERLHGLEQKACLEYSLTVRGTPGALGVASRYFQAQLIVQCWARVEPVGDSRRLIDLARVGERRHQFHGSLVGMRIGI